MRADWVFVTKVLAEGYRIGYEWPERKEKDYGWQSRTCDGKGNHSL